MSRPQLSLSKFKVKKNMTFENEYRGSAWLFFNDMWDDDAGRFRALSPKQQAAINEVHQIMHRNDMCIRISIQERNGDDVRNFPRTAGFSMRVNEPEIMDDLDDSDKLDDLD